MQAEHTSAAADQDRAIDAAIMDLLLIDFAGPWTESEIGAEIGGEVDTADGLARLARGGMVRRVDGFVFASRTAARAAAVLRG